MRLIQALATKPEDEATYLAYIKTMLKSNDFRLNALSSSSEAEEAYLTRYSFAGEEIVLPASILQCLEKSGSPEDLEPPQSPTPEELEGCPPEKRRREMHRCSVCDCTFDHLDVLLSHREGEHPTERGVIDRPQLSLVRTSPSLNVDEEEDGPKHSS
ncbi:hypothetical protein TcWFU_008973 [Taenia crassiceps]|uniref:C2H2-type domain-containing protein n=1 Tax=Taenia crassiceps TaxID=6207 RepID=A0ABR4Q274_9CEST